MKTVIAMLVASVLFSSCAVMFGGSKYNAQISVKDHPKAKIMINGIERGKGSATLLLPRKDNLNLTIQEEDCDDVNLVYPKELRATFALDLLTGWYLFIPALIVDFATGATYRPDLDTPNVTRLNMKTYQYQVVYTGCDE